MSDASKTASKVLMTAEDAMGWIEGALEEGASSRAPVQQALEVLRSALALPKEDRGVQAVIGEVITGLLARADREIAEASQADLEGYWFFRWDPARSVAWNTYQFVDLLRLYQSHCRRWEERHHGSQCVVERVRDTYLMPKIEAFTEQMRAALRPPGQTKAYWEPHEAPHCPSCDGGNDAVTASSGKSQG